jgi:adenylylsulfate kinase
MTGAVVWCTGLPASGKSTLAHTLAARLRELGIATLILDGDEVRAALVPAPGYDDDARDAFYATLGHLAVLAAAQGLIVVVPATAHRRAWRDQTRAAAPRFVEVHVATPIEECRRRDPKRLYAERTAALPGTGVAYEPPLAPEIVVRPGAEPAAIDAIIEVLEHGGPRADRVLV